MNCSTPGLPVHHQLPEFTQTHVHWVSDAIQPSHPLSSPFSSCPQSLSASESFPMSQLFTWGGQSTGVSALASFLPKKSQDRYKEANWRWPVVGSGTWLWLMGTNEQMGIRTTWKTPRCKDYLGQSPFPMPWQYIMSLSLDWTLKEK